MLVRTFTKAEHPEYGYEGLCADWMANAEPGNGLLCAHDMLEHFASDPGPAEGEFMALGASIYIRGQNGWFLTERSTFTATVPEVYARDFDSILERIVDGIETLCDPGVTRPLGEPMDENTVGNAVRLGFQFARAGFRHRYGDGDTIDFEGYPQIEDVLSEESQRRVLGWMRKGFRKAERRYAKVDSYSLSRAFTRLAKAIDQAAAQAERGDQIVARLDLRYLEVSAEVRYAGYGGR